MVFPFNILGNPGESGANFLDVFDVHKSNIIKNNQADWGLIAPRAWHRIL